MIEGFSALQKWIRENLHYITGKPFTQNQHTQIFDTGAIAKLKELEQENRHMQNQINSFANERKEIEHKFETKRRQREKEFLGIQAKYEAKISILEGEKDKLIKELMQVKMILRRPFLYQKYKNAKFEYFEHLNIWKFDPPLEERVRRKKYKSLSLDKGWKETLNKDLAENPPNTQKL